MKNSTLTRRPSNDMKKNAGYNKPTRRSDQSGDGEDFAFNGQMGDGVNRRKEGTKCANPYSIGDRALSMNKGIGPRVGNASSSADKIGPSATKDPKTLTIATASQGGRIDGGATVKQWPNPDSIYVGK